MSIGRYNIVDKDKGYADLVRRILGPDNPSLRVGVFEKPGQVPYGDSGATVTQVALFNEFGTETIPPRPFIRLYVDGQSARVHALIRASIEQVITHRLTKAQALTRLGMKLVGEIRSAISVGYFGAYDPNAPATIAKKGSDTPLIETGQLRDAIDYKVDADFSGIKDER